MVRREREGRSIAEADLDEKLVKSEWFGSAGSVGNRTR